MTNEITLSRCTRCHQNVRERYAVLGLCKECAEDELRRLREHVGIGLREHNDSAEECEQQVGRRIEILKSTFGNDAGDRVKVLHATPGELYYNDCYRRYVYIEKAEEGYSWRWVKTRKAQHNENETG